MQSTVNTDNSDFFINSKQSKYIDTYSHILDVVLTLDRHATDSGDTDNVICSCVFNRLQVTACSFGKD